MALRRCTTCYAISDRTSQYTSITSMRLGRQERLCPECLEEWTTRHSRLSPVNYTKTMLAFERHKTTQRLTRWIKLVAAHVEL